MCDDVSTIYLIPKQREKNKMYWNLLSMLWDTTITKSMCKKERTARLEQ